MKITRKSAFTGEIHTMELNVTPEQMKEYADGGRHIQHIFPHLTAGEREFIKTGVTQEEWDAVFSKID